MRTHWPAAILAVVAVLAPASAQSYPDKAVKFIVPFAAGSATDTLARVLGEQIGKAQGWQVVIENMAGANGTIAARTVARATPDGYTVLIGTNTTHAAAHSLMKSVPYDQIADFEHLTRLGSIALALVTHPSMPVKTVTELVAHGKANPGNLTFGSGSSSSRLAGEMLKVMTGLDVRHVAYRSNPLAMQRRRLRGRPSPRPLPRRGVRGVRMRLGHGVIARPATHDCNVTARGTRRKASRLRRVLMA